jgi:hypothetical protein
MRIRRRMVSIVCLLVVIGASIVFLFGILEDRHQRRQAEQLLQVLQQVRVGSTDRATVVQMVRPFPQYLEELPPGDQLTFVFYNKWLHRLRLAPQVVLRATVVFNDGVVVDKRAYEIVSTTGCAAEVVERKRGFGIPDGFPVSPKHKVGAWPDNSGQRVTRIRIENDDTYGEKERRNDWTFDLSCMTRIGRGCRDARVMLPNAVVSLTDEEVPSGVTHVPTR